MGYVVMYRSIFDTVGELIQAETLNESNKAMRRFSGQTFSLSTTWVLRSCRSSPENICLRLLCAAMNLGLRS